MKLNRNIDLWWRSVCRLAFTICNTFPWILTTELNLVLASIRRTNSKTSNFSETRTSFLPRQRQQSGCLFETPQILQSAFRLSVRAKKKRNKILLQANSSWLQYKPHARLIALEEPEFLPQLCSSVFPAKSLPQISSRDTSHSTKDCYHSREQCGLMRFQIWALNFTLRGDIFSTLMNSNAYWHS